jgi:hypothetical protein
MVTRVPDIIHVSGKDISLNMHYAFGIGWLEAI